MDTDIESSAVSGLVQQENMVKTLETEPEIESHRPNTGVSGLVKERFDNIVENVKGLNPEEWFALIVKASMLSAMIPVLSVAIFGAIKNLEIAASDLQMLDDYDSTASLEFDPTLGSEVSSENGRALVVVHEGFGELYAPSKYEDNERYQDYLRSLNAREEMYLEQGDIVVIVEERPVWDEEAHEARENVVYYVTAPANGFPTLVVYNDGTLQEQDVTALYQVLKDAGVEDIEMAGEFRDACVTQVMLGFERAGFEIEWCEDCVFDSSAEE